MEQSSFITNKDKLLSDIIKGILPKSTSLDVLVGYFYFSGYKLISEQLINKYVRILVGLDIDHNITKHIREIDMLSDYHKSRLQLKEEFYDHFTQLFNETDFLDSQPKLESFKLFYNKIKEGSLEIRKTDEPCHAKMYIFDYRDEISEAGEDPGSVITGSSNLSYEGLVGRVEINARFNDKGSYTDAKTIFNELWDKAIVIADKEHVGDFDTKIIDRIWYEKLYAPYKMYLRVLKEYFTIPPTENLLTPYDITEGKFSNLKYQTDAVQMAINAIRNHNGVIVADVVGLGKSIIASTVARNMRLRVLVICPPHLEDQWKGYRDDFGFTASIFTSGKMEEALNYYERIVKPNEQYLIVVDEAHRYRNEYTIDYTILHQLCSGNKVMLLTATPFNNKPDDIYAMLKLFQIPTKSSLKTVDNLGAKFKDLIAAYKQLQKDQREGKVSDDEVAKAAGKIANEIRSIISPLVIRRSRIDLMGIPEYAEDLEQQNIQLVIPHDPVELDYDLSSLKDLYLDTLDRISEDENGKKSDGRYRFKAARYSPVLYIKEELKQELSDLLEERTGVELNLLLGRQANVAKFMRRLLVRRFESSENAFKMSLEYMLNSSKQILKWIEDKKKMPVYKKGNLPDVDDFYKTDDDGNDLITETYEKYEKRGFFEIDMKYIKDSFVEDIKSDMALLQDIQKQWFGTDRIIKNDSKLESFKTILKQQIDNDPKRKVLVFTEFADTANYLGKELQDYGLPVFKYTSADASQVNKNIINTNFNASEKAHLQKDDFKILVATDAISEGYNLHRAGTVINYDIPYNPTRIIQRIGRINRVNKKVFSELYIYNYFPTDVGESETRTKEISTLKMAMIHAIMGEDTKVLTKEEEIQSYFLEQYRKEMSKSEEASWDLKYLKLLNAAKGTEVYEEALAIPHRARTGRTAEKPNKGVLMFGKKGNDFVFKLGNEEGLVEQLTAEQAMGLFEAEQSEKPAALSEGFDTAYQLVKAHLFSGEVQDKNEKIRLEAMQKVKVMLTKKALPADYLKDLMKVIQSDGLSGYELRFINKLKPSEYPSLLEQIDEYYINRIIETCNHVDDGEESIILAEELK
ncbi:MAG: helicase [Bacteroidales bacterium]|nr:helicase [Bacteroidales bacterium]